MHEHSPSLATPEQETLHITGILDNMRKLAEGVYRDPTTAFDYKFHRKKIPEVGNLFWLQIGHEINVRATQKAADDSPKGVEVDCTFNNQGEDFALNDGESAFTLSAPRVNSGGKAYYSFRQGENGGFEVKTYDDETLTADDLEAFEMLMARIAEEAPHISEYHA